MSDRIVVLNDGRIEQVGSPHAVYNRPANFFVATFIGNPSINFLEGTVDEIANRTAHVESHGERFELRLDEPESVRIGDAVRLGIRPQHVRLRPDATDAHYSGELTLFEPVDDRAHTTITGPEGEFRAVTNANATIEEGDTVGLRIDEAHVLLFDPQTGDLLGRAVSLDEAPVQDP